MSLNKKIYLLSNGCPENRIDTARIQKFFKQNGYRITPRLKKADVVVFNSCAHTQSSENCSVEIIKRIKKIKKPSGELIVCGCFPKINRNRLKGIHTGITFGPDEMNRLNEIFKPKVKLEHINSNYLITLTKYLQRYKWLTRNLKEKGLSLSILKLIQQKKNAAVSVCRPDTFFIKVSSGCLGNCAFCAIRFSRGRLKSKPIEKITEEFNEGLRKGFKEFALIGTEVGAYGKEDNISLVTLLKKLISIEGDYKIKLRNVHPVFLIEMLPELCSIFASGKISFLACALESGNNRILKLMNRGYAAEDFKAAIQVLNQEFPEIKLRTQVMIGFPSETEEEFKDTLKFMDELHFDFIETYIFQSRLGTEAAAMPRQIFPKVKRRRCRRLLLKLIFKGRK